MLNESKSYGAIHKIGKTDAEIVTGKYCSIASNVRAYLTGHHLDSVSTFPFHYFYKHVPDIASNVVHYGDLVIGNDVYVGGDVTFIGGVSVGDGAVIGAGSVVRESIPPYCIVLGNPARCVGYRFVPRVVESLLRIKWWDWPEDKIEQYLPLLSRGDVEQFIKEVGHVEAKEI